MSEGETRRMSASGGRDVGRGGSSNVDVSSASSCSEGGDTAGGGAAAAGGGGGGVERAAEGGGAYFGVFAWKKERMESWAGLVDGNDMLATVYICTWR
jgi:hypothetical protein